MTHRATPKFWTCYHQLPEEIQRLTDRCCQLLREDPPHASLRLRKIGRFWSVRVGLHYRALAVEHAGDLIWFWIGSHAEYDRLIDRQ